MARSDRRERSIVEVKDYSEEETMTELSIDEEEDCSEEEMVTELSNDEEEDCSEEEMATEEEDSEDDPSENDDSEDDPTYDFHEENLLSLSQASLKKPKSRRVRKKTDSEDDPTPDILEETRVSLSKISLKKSKTHHRVYKENDPEGLEDSQCEEVIEPALYHRVHKENDSEGLEDSQSEEVTDPALDASDEDCFEKVQKIIRDSQVEKLTVNQCKVYLRNYGLRLTGKKTVLIERIREHLEIINGDGEKRYPVSSFVLNCKGDACTGDVVMFEQNVYEMYSIASRSATGPPCGTRIVVGRIIKESYGALKQQHTFTIEVLWSRGEKPLPPLHPLLIKGRNLYKLKTMRQPWNDEGERKNVLNEKHSRGQVARSSRETRIQQKELRKMGNGRRTSGKENSGKQEQGSKTRGKENSGKQEEQGNKDLHNPIQTINITHHPQNPNKTIHQSNFPNVSVGDAPKHIPTAQGYPKVDLARFALNQGQTHAGTTVAPYLQRWNPPPSQKILAGIRQAPPPPPPSRQFHWVNPTSAGGMRHFNTNSSQSFDERRPLYMLNGGHPFDERRRPLYALNTSIPLQKPLCPYYAQGRCTYGDSCKFLHK